MVIRLTEHFGGLFELKGYTNIEEIDVWYYTRREFCGNLQDNYIFNIIRNSEKKIFGVESEELARNNIYNLLAIETNALLNKFPDIKVTESLKEGRESKLVGKNITTTHFICDNCEKVIVPYDESYVSSIHSD